MPRRTEAEEYLKLGLLPSEIAAKMGISAPSVIQYLRTRVGEGAIRFSDIYFCWPVEKRSLLSQAADDIKKGAAIDTRNGFRSDDLDFFKSIRKRRIFAGDLYEHLAETELAVHDMAYHGLVKCFGEGEAGYWRKGVPAGIRKRCHERREDDDEPSDSPFQYTTLIELAEIVTKNWKIFRELLPHPYPDNRHLLTSDFARLNGIRNTVMHPVKRRRWDDEDFEFAKRLRLAFEKFRNS